MYRRFVFGCFVFSAMAFGAWSAERDDIDTYKPWPQNKLMIKAMVKFPLLARLLGYESSPAVFIYG